MRYGWSNFHVFFSSSWFGGLDYSLRTLAKNSCNFLMHSLIVLKFGTNKDHIKVNQVQSLV